MSVNLKHLHTAKKFPKCIAPTVAPPANDRRSLGTVCGRVEEAVRAYRHALEERTRDRVPRDWATTQNNLGNALKVLGERESGTARSPKNIPAR